MIKHKKTQSSQSKVTILFGYSIFALMVLSFLLTTAIPFAFSFQYPSARHFNIAVMVISFAIATILPALASYFIGDKATHSKNKSLHHYNGVLFGVAAYWVAMLFSSVGYMRVAELPFPAHLAFTNITPVILTIALMAVIAAVYAKKVNNSTSVLQYLPFQLVLIGSVLGALLVPYLFGNYEFNFNGMILVILSIPFIATGVAYIILAKYQATRLARLSDAIVAMTMGSVSIWLAYSFISFLQLPYLIADLLAYSIGLAVFVPYLYLRARKLK